MFYCLFLCRKHLYKNKKLYKSRKYKNIKKNNVENVYFINKYSTKFSTWYNINNNT